MSVRRISNVLAPYLPSDVRAGAAGPGTVGCLSAVEVLRPNALVRRSAPPPGVERIDTPYDGPVSVRVAKAIVRGLDSPEDLRRIKDWAAYVLTTEGTLKGWCQTLGESARCAQVFMRMLRVVMSGHTMRASLIGTIDVSDKRTLRRLVRLSGGDPDRLSLPFGPQQFIERQCWLRDPSTLAAVRRYLAHRAARASGKEV